MTMGRELSDTTTVTLENFWRNSEEKCGSTRITSCVRNMMTYTTLSDPITILRLSRILSLRRVSKMPNLIYNPNYSNELERKLEILATSLFVFPFANKNTTFLSDM